MFALLGLAGERLPTDFWEHVAAVAQKVFPECFTNATAAKWAQDFAKFPSL